MAKTTTSKTQKTDVAKKPTVTAEKPAAAETVKTGTTEVKDSQEEKKEVPTENTETQEEKKGSSTEKSGNDFPFKVNSDGTVDIWSKKRANKSVIGSTGEIVTFDEKGFAKVKIEDALHFKDVPGFSFNEE